MNMFKKNGGFTLVELIVVIAILAILAGIAVPAYSGYLKSAEKAGDITTLSAVKTAAFAAMATEGEVHDIEVIAKEGVVYSVKVNMVYANDVEEKDDEGNDIKTEPVVLYQVEDAGDAATTDDDKEKVENADFMLYMNNALPKLTYFTDGAYYDVAPAKAYAEMAEGTDALTEDQQKALKAWEDVFGNGWASKADADKLNTDYPNSYPNL